MIDVADQGPGVESALAEAIFEPFRRGTTSASGYGIGLALVRFVAEGHGGTAVHSATPDGGSRFTIRLPIQV